MSGLEHYKAKQILYKIKSNQFHKIFVAVQNEKVIGCITIIVEPKFIHNCGYVAHLEDLVVQQRARGQKIAKRLVKKTVDFAQENKCYKILTDCKDKLQLFWNDCDFVRCENAMR